MIIINPIFKKRKEIRQSFLKDELKDVNFIPPLKSVKKLMFREALPDQMPSLPDLPSEILGKSIILLQWTCMFLAGRRMLLCTCIMNTVTYKPVMCIHLPVF